MIDVEARSSAAGDILIRDGLVAAIGDVPEREAQAADERFDATGSYVSPGWIDIHAHLYNHGLFTTSRLDADRVGLGQGVTCLVDAGSSGAVSIDAFPRVVLETQRTPVFGLVNVGSPGLPNLGGGHSSRPELVSLGSTVEAAERHAGWVRGIKVQASSSHAGMFGIEAVKIARKAADLTALPVMAHIGNAPPVLDETLSLLRAGDIVTHAYHGKIGGALSRHGEALPALRDAVERGVIVDIGHGRSSFSFATCEQALAEGLPVHTISTDIHRGNIDRYVVSLARTMSKLMLLGLSLEEVVSAVTVTPAQALRLDRDGHGTLAVGRSAHITIFRIRDEPIELEDSTGETRTAEQWLDPLAAFSRGERFDRDLPI
ncbi:MAG TPA: amidohydrolase/deacetylase family metallohydrolase [Dehalococcoidia bacterium]|nr:amidohydrolase/deacetylase family metallohydrolase [Dehalococcoidia bacterium]